MYCIMNTILLDLGSGFRLKVQGNKHNRFLLIPVYTFLAYIFTLSKLLHFFYSKAEESLFYSNKEGEIPANLMLTETLRYHLDEKLSSEGM